MNYRSIVEEQIEKLRAIKTTDESAACRIAYAIADLCERLTKMN